MFLFDLKGIHEGEENVSAEYATPEAHARLSRTHEHQERAARVEAAPREGA
jgi:hypothetical protein